MVKIDYPVIDGMRATAANQISTRQALAYFEDFQPVYGCPNDYSPKSKYRLPIAIVMALAGTVVASGVLAIDFAIRYQL